MGPPSQTRETRILGENLAPVLEGCGPPSHLLTVGSPSQSAEGRHPCWERREAPRNQPPWAAALGWVNSRGSQSSRPTSVLLQMAPARVQSYTRTVGPPGPSQHCFSCRLMAVLCSVLSMLMVTVVACYSHHLLSWSKKRGSCCCFKITVTPHHFPNEGETPELSL